MDLNLHHRVVVVTGAGRSFTAAPPPASARASTTSTMRALERFVRGTNRERAGAAEVARGTPRSEDGAEGSSAGRVIVWAPRA